MIAKILSRRISRVIDRIISINQSAFIRNRPNLCGSRNSPLLESISIGREYEMAMKWDMRKDFGRVECSFLRSMVQRLGLDPIWIGWIMKCITTVSYSMLINGESHGYIRPTRCIRQDDQFSAPLFLILELKLLDNYMGH